MAKENQREIKFRAWDKMLKKMVYEPEFYYDENDIKLNEIIKRLITENYFLLQFTGLKDKNGKEIYEGDIVELISFAGVKTINEIIYNEKECAFTTKTGYLFARFKKEVIGNIYENPELLKSS